MKRCDGCEERCNYLFFKFVIAFSSFFFFFSDDPMAENNYTMRENDAMRENEAVDAKNEANE